MANDPNITDSVPDAQAVKAIDRAADSEKYKPRVHTRGTLGGDYTVTTTYDTPFGIKTVTETNGGAAEMQYQPARNPLELGWKQEYSREKFANVWRIDAKDMTPLARQHVIDHLASQGVVAKEFSPLAGNGTFIDVPAGNAALKGTTPKDFGRMVTEFQAVQRSATTHTVAHRDNSTLASASYTSSLNEGVASSGSHLPAASQETLLEAVQRSIANPDNFIAKGQEASVYGLEGYDDYVIRVTTDNVAGETTHFTAADDIFSGANLGQEVMKGYGFSICRRQTGVSPRKIIAEGIEHHKTAGTKYPEMQAVAEFWDKMADLPPESYQNFLNDMNAATKAGHRIDPANCNYLVDFNQHPPRIGWVDIAPNGNVESNNSVQGARQTIFSVLNQNALGIEIHDGPDSALRNDAMWGNQDAAAIIERMEKAHEKIRSSINAAGEITQTPKTADDVAAYQEKIGAKNKQLYTENSPKITAEMTVADFATHVTQKGALSTHFINATNGEGLHTTMVSSSIPLTAHNEGNAVGTSHTTSVQPSLAPLENTPILYDPPLTEALAAQHALKEVQTKNQHSTTPVAGISGEHANTIMQWVVHRTRTALLNEERMSNPTPQSPVAFFESEDVMPERCVKALSLAAAQTDRVWEIETFRHQTDRLLKNGHAGHAFLVVALPVTTAEGKVEKAHYLIDPTFRQFTKRDAPDPWVQEMIKTPEGHALAQGLLKQGYMPLTEKTAEIYLGSHVKIAEEKAPSPKPSPQVEGHALELLGKESYTTGVYDFGEDLVEMDGHRIDLRSPQLVAGVSDLMTTFKVPADRPGVTTANNTHGESHSRTTDVSTTSASIGAQAHSTEAYVQAGEVRISSSNDGPQTLHTRFVGPCVTLVRYDASGNTSGMYHLWVDMTTQDDAVNKIRQLLDGAGSQSRISIIGGMDNAHSTGRPDLVNSSEQAIALMKQEIVRSGALLVHEDTMGDHQREIRVHANGDLEVNDLAQQGSGKYPYTRNLVTSETLGSPVQTNTTTAMGDVANTTSHVSAGTGMSHSEPHTGTTTGGVSGHAPNVAYSSVTPGTTTTAHTFNVGGTSAMVGAVMLPQGGVGRSFQETMRGFFDGTGVQALPLPANARSAPGQTETVQDNTTTHAAVGDHHVMNGVGLAMSAREWQAIDEKRKAGQSVSTLEVAAATLNSGSSIMSAAGLSLDDMAAQGLAKIAPKLARGGGPLVQVALSVPMLMSAYKTGDTQTIGAATWGIGGGIAAGVAGQMLIPIPVVGFVAGVVVGDGAAKIGGLVNTIAYNDDPAKRAAAKEELLELGYDYAASPGGPINLLGAATSSIGRAVTALGQVTHYGGQKLDELADFGKEQCDKHLPKVVSTVAKGLITYSTTLTSTTLKVAGKTVEAVGEIVDHGGKAAEYIGHKANDAVEYIAQGVTKTAKEIYHHPEKAVAIITTHTKSAAHTVVNGVKTIGNDISTAAQDTYASCKKEVMSWFETDSDKRWQATLTDLEKKGWGKHVGNHDNHITLDELKKTFKDKGIAFNSLDKNGDGISGKEITDALHPAQKPAPDKQWQATLVALEKSGWGKYLGNHDNHITLDEVKKTLAAHGVAFDNKSLDKNGNGIEAKEIADALNAHGVAHHGAKKPTTGRA